VCRVTMALTLETLPQTLLARGLVTPGAIVGGRFKAHDLSRRNRVFRVILGDGGLLVKQAGKENNHLGLRIEAYALGHLGSRRDGRALRDCIPELVHFDPQSMLVATRLLHPATSLTKVHMNGGQPDFPAPMAARAGEVLALLHSLPVPAADPADGPTLRRGPIHNVNRPFHYGWGYSREEFTGALLEVFRHVDSRLPHFHAAAEQVSASWRHESFMHGDVRWDNFLVGARDDGFDLRLVDWEFFSVGDPAWDVAAYLAEHVRYWSFLTFPASAQQIPDSRRYRDTSMLVPCQPAAFHAAARAFVDAYRRGRGLDGDAWRAFVDRVFRMLPYAYFRILAEQTAGQSVLPAGPSLLLTLLAEWVDDTDRAAQEFFGFGRDTA
jgi:hypothetical protein